MTRTFRRTCRGIKTDFLPDPYKSEEYKELFDGFRWTARYYFSQEYFEANRQWRKIKEEHPEYNDWFMGGVGTEPGPRWFRNYYTTRPRRAKERRLCQKIKSGYCDYDEVTFPIHGKPHIYYT